MQAVAAGGAKSGVRAKDTEAAGFPGQQDSSNDSFGMRRQPWRRSQSWAATGNFCFLLACVPVPAGPPLAQNHLPMGRCAHRPCSGARKTQCGFCRCGATERGAGRCLFVLAQDIALGKGRRGGLRDFARRPTQQPSQGPRDVVFPTLQCLSDKTWRSACLRRAGWSCNLEAGLFFSILAGCAWRQAESVDIAVCAFLCGVAQVGCAVGVTS